MRTLPVMLGARGEETPQESDFAGFNGLITPRKLDTLLLFQNLLSEPVFYSAYTTWASDLGATLMITLAPGSGTLGAFTSGTYDTSGLYSNQGLAGLGAQCASYGKPMYIRLCQEFNGDWYTYGNTQETAAQFVAGWKHVVTAFRNAGASNVSWVWCANVWGLAGVAADVVDPTVADGSGVNWYPGDAYADFISLDGYMSTSGDARTPSTLFGPSYTALTGAFSKPFGIAEVGCAADPRLTALCGGKPGWYSQFFSMVATWKNCAFVNNWQGVVVPPDTNDGDYTINSSGTDSAAQAAFAAGVSAYPFTAQPAARYPALQRLGGC